MNISRFPDMGVPLVIIHLNRIFQCKQSLKPIENTMLGNNTGMIPPIQDVPNIFNDINHPYL